MSLARQSTAERRTISRSFRGAPASAFIRANALAAASGMTAVHPNTLDSTLTDDATAALRTDGDNFQTSTDGDTERWDLRYDLPQGFGLVAHGPRNEADKLSTSSCGPSSPSSPSWLSSPCGFPFRLWGAQEGKHAPDEISWTDSVRSIKI